MKLQIAHAEAIEVSQPHQKSPNRKRKKDDFNGNKGPDRRTAGEKRINHGGGVFTISGGARGSGPSGHVTRCKSADSIFLLGLSLVFFFFFLPFLIFPFFFVFIAIN